MRVTLDTNIYVSAFALHGSHADEAVRAAVEGRYELIVSAALLAELANVLQRKFQWEHERILNVCRILSETSLVVRPSMTLRVFKDDPDNRILECALAGKADFIVTGDKHMLALNDCQGVRIITLAGFIGKIK
ncbi:MAG: putative toxin-antitoxin system toxin component, PIN family [Elusimicrobia bacterium RIFCSPLOWO2_01_FULL_59_12]|nr:MAG: putative toxin-antitoxin system toxin component, PIN family [Elusimicrobia bacterium RIFCSPLOWO2_01_FULL_59_12]